MLAIFIPADDSQPIEVRDVGQTIGTIADAIGARYVERRRCSLTGTDDDLSLSLAVDEDGIGRARRANDRATLLYLGPIGAAHVEWPIAGDALVLQEGMTSGGADWLDLGTHADRALEMVNERMEEGGPL